MAWYSTLSGQNCSDPGSIADSLRSEPLSEELPLWRRANSYYCPVGQSPGVAYVLLQRSRLDALDANSTHTLTFRSDFEDVAIPNLRITRALSMFGQAGDSRSPMLVELKDPRCVAMRSAINAGYNVPIPCPSNSATATNLYYPETLDGGSLWTWQGMLDSIWALTGMPGTPALASPSGNPHDFRFFGVSAWDALHVALGSIQATTAYQPISGAFSYIGLGESQPGLAAAISSLDNRLMQTFDPLAGANAANMPATVRVFFHKRSAWYGIERDTPRADNWESSPVHFVDIATGITGALGTLAVQSDLHALIDAQGNMTNSADLNANAAAISAEITGNLPIRRHLVFSGAVSAVLPGAEVDEVTWRDYGDQDGLVTVVRTSHGLTIEPKGSGGGAAWDVIKPGDYGRRTHPNYPRTQQIVQVSDEVATEMGYLEPTDGTLPGAADDQLKMFPGVVRLIRDGLEELEPCWIAFSTSWDAQSQTSFGVYNSQFLVGRLAGTASGLRNAEQEDPSEQEYPLYIVEKLPSLLVKSQGCLVPLQSNTVTAKVMEFDVASSSWSPHATATIAIYDSENRVCLTPDDAPVWVEWNEASSRYEVEGQYGLIRRATAAESIPADGTGNVVIYGNADQAQATCDGEATNCVATVCNTWGSPAAIQQNDDVWIVYEPGSYKWYVLSAAAGMKTEAIVLVRAEACKQVGDSVLTTVFEWDGSQWADSGMTKTVYDPASSVFMLPGEYHWAVIHGTRYDFVGEFGLSRRAQVDANIDVGQTAAATILDATASCAGVASNCTITVCNDGVPTGKSMPVATPVFTGQVVHVQWYENRWHIIYAPNDLVVVRAKTCKDPSDINTTCDILKWNEAAVIWDDSLLDAQVSDPFQKVSLLPEEIHWATRVKHPSNENEYVFVGEHGLSRRCSADEAIDCDDSGSLTIIDHIDSCNGDLSSCKITACNAPNPLVGRSGRKIRDLEEVHVRWYEGKWHILPPPDPGPIEADLSQVMCPTDATRTINNVNKLGQCLPSDPTTAVNHFCLAGEIGDTVLLYFVADNGQGASEWRIQQVKHRVGEIVEDICLVGGSDLTQSSDCPEQGSDECQVQMKVRQVAVMGCGAEWKKAFAATATDVLVNVVDDGECVNQVPQLVYVLCVGAEGDPEAIFCTKECVSSS